MSKEHMKIEGGGRERERQIGKEIERKWREDNNIADHKWYISPSKIGLMNKVNFLIVKSAINEKLLRYEYHYFNFSPSLSLLWYYMHNHTCI